MVIREKEQEASHYGPRHLPRKSREGNKWYHVTGRGKKYRGRISYMFNRIKKEKKEESPLVRGSQRRGEAGKGGGDRICRGFLKKGEVKGPCSAFEEKTKEHLREP